MNAIAVAAVGTLALVFENITAPSFGFYLIPAAVAVVSFFSLPFVVRSLNALIAGVAGFAILSAWQGSMVFFTLPYFLLISLVLYGIAKK